MGIVNSNKEINKAKINCKETFNVKLSITAAPDIVNNPTDIVLVLDRSGSMTGSPLLNLKNGAKKFVEIIDEATDSTQDGQIGNGSHIGIVSFSTTATKDTELITSVADLDSAIDNLTAGGSTNHADAFTKATELFDTTSSNAKVIVLFTDGVTTAGSDPTVVADFAKSQGIIIYCIGLAGDTGLDVNALNDWSSDPDSAYVAITPDDAELEDLFEELAKNISNPGATNIVITDTLNSCFKLTGVIDITKGSANIQNDNVITWEIEELGTTSSEGATLEFSVEHVGSCTGIVEVNESIDYEDDEGNIALFANPTIEIECDTPICIDECPIPVDIEIIGCNDTLEYDAGDLYMDSLGRILELSVKIKNVCPNRRVALAVMLSEVDANDVEYQRGMKTMVLPAHNNSSCKDVKVECIKFVLPEELNVGGYSLCNERNFKARFIVHYIDNDFCCCDNQVL